MEGRWKGDANIKEQRLNGCKSTYRWGRPHIGCPLLWDPVCHQIIVLHKNYVKMNSRVLRFSVFVVLPSFSFFVLSLTSSSNDISSIFDAKLGSGTRIDPKNSATERLEIVRRRKRGRES